MAGQGRVLSFVQGPPTRTGAGTDYDGFPRHDATTGEVAQGRERVGRVEQPMPSSRGGRTVPLQNLGSQRLRLSHPLFVVLEESDGLFVAISYDLELAEQGDTEFEALDALRAAVVELYQDLTEMGSDAPDRLRARLDFLESLRD